MNIDFNAMAIHSHFEANAANKIRATAIASAVRNNPAMVAGMYASVPTWIHELPLEHVAKVADELCDAGFKAVVTDMSENRAISREYRQVLAAVAEGESVII